MGFGLSIAPPFPSPVAEYIAHFTAQPRTRRPRLHGLSPNSCRTQFHRVRHTLRANRKCASSLRHGPRKAGIGTRATLRHEGFAGDEKSAADPPERVFQAITDPAQLSQWWGQGNLYHMTERGSDLRVGGRLWCAAPTPDFPMPC